MRAWFHHPVARIGWVAAALAVTLVVSSGWSGDPVVAPATVPLAPPRPAGARAATARVPGLPLQERVALAAAPASGLPRLRSLLVSHRGSLVFERYYNGARRDRPANIKSASKSVLSALVGIALADGHLRDVSEPIASYLAADLRNVTDARKRTITVEHLLTMQTGLESTSGRNYGAWVTSGNWVRYALRQPLIAEPGTVMEYSTGNSHLLSALLTRATGRSTWAFAQEALATPLGFRLPRWPQDPQGIYFGGNDMLMTPRQMVAFGELYRNDGRVDGRRLFPERWVARTFEPRGRSRWGSDREYGYGWWIRSLAGRQAYYAWGYGGQFVFVVPDAEMVVVTTSDPNVSRERREHLGGIYDLAADVIRAADDADDADDADGADGADGADTERGAGGEKG